MAATENTSQQQVAPATDTLYSKLRVLALFSKILGAFPLCNTLKKDGRSLKFKWFDKGHIWDCMICGATMYIFIQSCVYLLEKTHTNENGTIVRMWLLLTCYIVSARALIQFTLVHIYAVRMPRLISELEEYHQIIGASILQPSKKRKYANILTMIWTIIILFTLQLASISFFSQLSSGGIFYDTWPVYISFMFANLWKELPLNLFALICMYMTARFHEIRNEIRKARQDGPERLGETLKSLRLKHAALARITSTLQRCYGTQLAVNLLFLLLDTVLQLFVYFSVTATENVYLLVLAAYYFISSVVLFAIVDRLERTGEILADELIAFDAEMESNKVVFSEIQLFIAQLTVRPIKVSASGFYIVNNTLVVSMIGSVATYLVVVIQFAPYFQAIANNTGLL